MRAVPITLREAYEYVRQHHRHLPKSGVGLFAIGVEESGQLVGVAIVGRPKARALDTGRNAEVTRLATNGARNACSFLYRACTRAAHAMGYERVLTYTLASESGASLRAAGFVQTRRTKAAQWSCPSRPRALVGLQEKLRWEAPPSSHNRGYET